MLNTVLSPRARAWVYLVLVVANVVVAFFAPPYALLVTNLASALGLSLAAGNVPTNGSEDARG